MNEKTRSDLDVEAWNALIGATWPVFTAFTASAQKAKTTTAQLSLLNVLYDSAGGITPLEVARCLSVTPGTVTGTLNRLEETGLIERARGERKDRRVIILRITPKGRDLVKHWRESCRVFYESAMTPLSDAELRTLITLLSRIGPPINGVPPGLALLIKPKSPNAAIHSTSRQKSPQSSKSRAK